MELIKQIWAAVVDFFARKPYVCPIDGKKFATIAQLQDHYAKFHPDKRRPIEIKWA